MPRISGSKISRSAERRITRSMTKAGPLCTLPNAAPTENAKTSTSHAAPYPQDKQARQKAGDKVMVYMRTEGEWSWRPGKVVIMGTFRVKPTGKVTFDCAHHEWANLEDDNEVKVEYAERAKEALAEHRPLYPDYKLRPVQKDG
ncbi:hypothetical protein TRAPUB_11894 [Trametes pubescens]|uniref:Uncharacterized protein n=1 Tax=Trametes pubescens TaxID=154538 RepID=A0A1M2VVF2_TRAPU|nr:hypothetical protein TRAPUB_11894 [Trametes pubescens]